MHTQTQAAHPLCPGSAHCAVSWPRTGRVAGIGGHVAGPPLAVSPLCRARPCALPAPYRSASSGRVALVLPHNLVAKPRVCHDTPICIVTQSPNSQALVHALLAIAGRPTVSQTMFAVLWRRLSRIVAEAWPCRGPQAVPRPHLPSPVSRYNPLYRGSTGQ